mmetsp:Transcript_5027/g.15512  ORF Transcript_5027/g.15512 Transcript_5027/m.15512 type:complete len:260 (+) Transcript_5027:88-867(+)
MSLAADGSPLGAGGPDAWLTTSLGSTAKYPNTWRQSLTSTSTILPQRGLLPGQGQKDAISKVRANLFSDAQPSEGNGVAQQAEASLASSALTPRQPGSTRGARGSVLIGGSRRPIRLDAQEHEAEHLRSLAREVKYAALSEQNHEIARRAELSEVSHEIDSIQMKRVDHSFQVPSWTSKTWRSVNIEKRRADRQDALHFVPPSQRGRLLRSIELERAAAWGPLCRQEAESGGSTPRRDRPRPPGAAAATPRGGSTWPRR